MKKSPVELKIKVRENPVKYICIGEHDVFSCFGEKDLKACLLANPNVRAYKVSREIAFDITHTVTLK